MHASEISFVSQPSNRQLMRIGKNITMAKVRTKKKSQTDTKAFFSFIHELSQQKKIEHSKLVDLVKKSFLAAYQKKYGIHANLSIVMDEDKREIAVIRNRTVVETPSNLDAQLSLEDACKIKRDSKIGDLIQDYHDALNFSRVTAASVRQILMQRLRDLEREVIYHEFQDKVGSLANGYFLRWRDRELVYVDLGSAEGILPRREQIPGERFRSGDRVKAIIKSIELRREKTREAGPFIILSRASTDFVKKLFEVEIPEIYDGVVEIVDVVRQAGYRTKLLVRSTRQDVDPVGACVGIRGVRIQSIVRELNNERIDIVNANQDTQALIASALSPAEVLEVRLDTKNREAFVVVSDASYSVAIGIIGHNVRLACQLSKYNIAVKSQSQFNEALASPEAKERMEALFQAKAQDEEVEEEYTTLYELPGLSHRIVAILENNQIKSVEELMEVGEEDLSRIKGIGKNTAKQIRKILSEVVEFEEV